MMWISSLFGGIKDPYERKARVAPALLVILPILTAGACLFGPRNVLLTSLVTLVGACGLVQALAGVVRHRGQTLEQRLFKRWGGMPTTIALRYRSGIYPLPLLARYHTALAQKTGLAFPNADSEQQDPTAADDIYITAVTQIRNRLRTHAPAMLTRELISYGFQRNMAAMRNVGISVAVMGVLAGILMMGAITLDSFSLHLSVLAHPDARGLCCGVVSLMLALVWTQHGEASVRRAGFCYAQQLFEAALTIRSTPPSTHKKASTRVQ